MVSKNQPAKPVLDNLGIQPVHGVDSFVPHKPHPGIQTDFVSIPSCLSVRETLRMLQNRTETAIIIQHFVNSEPMFYLFHRKELESALGNKNPDDTLLQALGLHESNQSPQISAPMARREMRERVLDRTVITDERRATGYTGLVLYKSAEKAPVRKIKSVLKEDISVMASVEEAPVRKMSARRGMSSERTAGVAMAEAAMPPPRPPVKAKPKKKQPPAGVKPAAAAKPTSASPVSGEATPLCHFGAQMPEEIAAGKTRQVEVTISREAIGLTAAAGSQEAAAPLPATPDQKITVRLIPKKNMEIVGDSRADVIVPMPGQPAVTLFFEVKPGSPGDSELWVAFCQGPVSLITLKLKPRIVEQPQANGESLEARGEAPQPAGPPARINIMRVYLGENGGKIRYRYTLWLDAQGVDQEYESPEFQGDITTILQPYLNLFDQVEAGSKTDFEQLQIQLRSIGARLFQTLFPRELQSVFWENRDKITHLKLYCEEPYIPWEILHVCKPGKPLPAETRFLGQMGLVRWLYGHTAPTELRVRPGRAWYVTPSYPGNELDSAKKEGALLKKIFDAHPVTPATRPAVTGLLSAEGPFDLFHFAGHGEASATQITEGRIELEPAGPDASSMLRDLTPDIVSGLCRLKAPDGTRPIVVLNSCRAGKTGYQVAGLGGFAPAFLEREAGVFVGALWMIGDEPALTFIKAFYEALRAGKVVAEAVNKGREEACKAGDATYLAYVVYADPFAHLVQ